MVVREGLAHHHEQDRERDEAIEGIEDISAIGTAATIDPTIADGQQDISRIGAASLIDIPAIKGKDYERTHSGIKCRDNERTHSGNKCRDNRQKTEKITDGFRFDRIRL